MAIHVIENYVSVEEFAALNENKRRSVMGRIKSKLISAITSLRSNLVLGKRNTMLPLPAGYYYR